ncbi:MAG: hypothetical protein GY861_17470 [bacterium]|nr:hypothetical protein [bacterium]
MKDKRYKYIVQGNSIREEFVHCNKCGGRFVWLKARMTGQGKFICVCRKCRLKIEKAKGLKK